MIELFSKAENTLRSEDAGPCIPLPLGDDISSLSAILLNEEYYSMLLNGKIVLSDISILSHTYLIHSRQKHGWITVTEGLMDSMLMKRISANTKMISSGWQHS